MKPQTDTIRVTKPAASPNPARERVMTRLGPGEVEWRQGDLRHVVLDVPVPWGDGRNMTTGLIQWGCA